MDRQELREWMHSPEVQETVARYTDSEEEVEQPQQGRLWEEMPSAAS